MVELFSSLIFVWSVHAVIATVLSAPIVFFGRRRVHWRWWELSALVLPFAVWSFFMLSDLATGRKSIANVGEPYFFSFAIPLAALVRVWLGTRFDERLSSAVLIGTLCAVAASVFVFVPSLPE